MNTQDSKPQNVTNIVDVTRKKVTTGPTSATITKRSHAILDYIGCEQCELSVVLCDDSFIHQLNKKHRNKDNATDVLSFPMTDAQKGAIKNELLGDVIISVDTARRQAEQRNHNLLTEVTTLLIHGILHLVGYTHETDEDENEMNSTADNIMKTFMSEKKVPV